MFFKNKSKREVMDVDSDIIIKVNNITKEYDLYNKPTDQLKEIFTFGKKKYHKTHQALNSITFEIRKGEHIGIIGTNGSGKSTLLKILTNVIVPSSGEVTINGKVSALLELGSGFNPDYTGIENIYLNGTVMGLTHSEIAKKIDEIIDFADIGEYINQPVKNYSSGMFARLAFAVAINVEPDILIVDEALSVGDIFFQNKCYKKFNELKNKGVTILFVSHDISSIKHMCSRVLWIEKGKQMMFGDSVEVCNAYTNSLLSQQVSELKDLENENGGIIETLVKEDYPAINWSSESIIDEEVKIVSCYIEDTNKKKVLECNPLMDYSIVVVFKSKRKIRNCIVGFVLETQKGLWIINSNSKICGEQKTYEISENSINKVEFKIRMPQLISGEYIIGVAVSEGRENQFEVITWLYNVLAVSIVNTGNNSALLDVATEIKISSRKEQENEI